MPEMQRHGAIGAWIIDDTGFPNTHSVGVARQYCGQLGKQDNCQIAVSLSLANHHASLPVAYRLYLPKERVDDGERRRKVGAPGDLVFKARLEIALEQLRWESGSAARCGLDGRRLRSQYRSAYSIPALEKRTLSHFFVD